nr:alcohol dehydrogenase catalytic domain-containing protein [Micromonospora sp. DSM 115978]
MRNTTTAYRMTSWLGEPELVDVAVPAPRAGQVLVRVAGNGLCHSDLTMRQIPAAIGEALGWRMPFTLGHECAGWIEEVSAPGPEWLAPGRPVALVSPTSCGTCQVCRRGLDSACPHGLAGRGYGRDGGLAGFVLVDDARSLGPLPAGLDPVAAGPLTDAGATSYHAVRRVADRLGAGTTAVVVGAGGLGAFAVQHL